MERNAVSRDPSRRFRGDAAKCSREGVLSGKSVPPTGSRAEAVAQQNDRWSLQQHRRAAVEPKAMGITPPGIRAGSGVRRGWRLLATRSRGRLLPALSLLAGRCGRRSLFAARSRRWALHFAAHRSAAATATAAAAATATAIVCVAAAAAATAAVAAVPATATAAAATTPTVVTGAAVVAPASTAATMSSTGVGVRFEGGQGNGHQCNQGC